MRKIFVIISLLSLCACKHAYFYSYTGTDISVSGEGGLFQGRYTTDVLNDDGGVFFGGMKEPDQMVDLWMRGLPENQKCFLIGFVEGNSYKKIAQKIFEAGGNTGTQTRYSFNARFDNGSGDVASTQVSDNDTYALKKNSYNVFYCE